MTSSIIFSVYAAEQASQGLAVNSTQSSMSANDLQALEHFIDGYVTSMTNDFDPPGVMVSVVLGDQQITKGYGLANAETGELNNEHSLFRIGSISKLFVWLSAHMLADQGKLDLDADINHYLNGFSIPEAFDRPITMRDLMAHRPGFDDNLRDFIDPDRDVSIAEAVKRNIPLRVAPAGERTSYSNTGTNIAAYVVEQVSGMPYSEFVQTNILQPVGMQSTTLHDPNIGRNPEALEARMAKPHKIKDGVAKVSGYMAVRPQEPVGAAALDALDAATFMRLLLNKTHYQGGQLLSDKAWALITTPAFEDAIGGDDMGWGFMLSNVDGLTAIGHGGATQFLSWMFVIPEINAGVFISTNMISPDSRAEGLAWAIARRLTNTGSLQAFLQLKGNVEAAKQVAGTYLNNRRPQNHGVALYGMGNDIKIRATDDGYLVLPGSKEARYAPLSKDVWTNKLGMRLRVVRDDSGEVLRLHTYFGSSTLERIGFISSTQALVMGVGGVVLLSLTSLIGMCLRYGRQLAVTSVGQKLGWVTVLSVLGWLTFVFAIAFLAIEMQSFDISKVDESVYPPLSVKWFFVVTILVSVITVIHLLSLIAVWTKSGWSLWRQIHFTVYGLFAFFVVYLMYHWNLIGGSIYGL
ncbi:serine hydrolase domain-containing protein [Paraglaciecola aestuariivivens]